MKISNSKKQLAKIISENGGWRKTAEFSAQDQDGEVFFYTAKPTRSGGWWLHDGELCGVCIVRDEAMPNWHQTILSRDEYFHLYPAQDAELVAMCADVTKENKHPEYCESVMRSIPEPSDKPTIEQLASDYKAKLAIARQAQEEADSRRADAEAALDRLYQAGLEIGLDIAIASDEDGEPELVITDWRDLKVGDEISTQSGIKHIVKDINHHDESHPICADDGDGCSWHVSSSGWRFIRRP